MYVARFTKNQPYIFVIASLTYDANVAAPANATPLLQILQIKTNLA